MSKAKDLSELGGVIVTDGSNVGIGTSSANAKLQVEGTDDANNLIVGHNNTHFAVYTDSTVGELRLKAEDGSGSNFSKYMTFYTNPSGSAATERMRIDSSGNVLVGKTTTSDGTTTVGFFVQPSGVAVLTRDGAAPLRVSRKTSDGEIISVHKDGTAVGRVGTFANSTSYCGASSGIYFNGANINPTTGDPTVRTDNANDIGQASQRFKDLYLGGGVYLGGTGAANKLDDYEEGTFTIGLNVASGSPSFSISNTTGYYIKVGKLVHFNWYSGAISVTNGGSGNVSLTGLPFFSNSAANNYSAFQYLHGNAFSQTTTGGYVNVNATNAFFIIQNQVGANVGLQTGTRYIMVRGTYYSA